MRLTALAALLLAAAPASLAAQAFKPGNPVTDANPYPTKTPGQVSTTTSGTIATANAYQSILAASANRKGCVVQNKSTATERIFLGAPAAATDATAIDVAAGNTFNCASPSGMVLLDQLSISSPTQGSAFVVVAQ